MKMLIPLLAAGMLLAGCVNTSKVMINASQLEHHRFVLASVNGHNLPVGTPELTLSFGDDLLVAGNMCNRFTGDGKLSDGTLTVKNLTTTHLACENPKLSELDNTISTMLRSGAQVDLTEKQLTLATIDQSLVYLQADQ